MKRFRGEVTGSSDHIYYNATIINTSSDPRPDMFPNVAFSDNRSIPLISDISDYEFSVVRFTAEGPGKALPVFIPRLQLGIIQPSNGLPYPQRDPDLLIYSFGIRYSVNFTMFDTDNNSYIKPWTGYASRYVRFKSEYVGMDAPAPPAPYVDSNGITVYPPYSTQDISTGYYSLSSIQSFLELANDTIAQCVLTNNNYMPIPDLHTQATEFWSQFFQITQNINSTMTVDVYTPFDPYTDRLIFEVNVATGLYSLPELISVINEIIANKCVEASYPQLCRVYIGADGHVYIIGMNGGTSPILKEGGLWVASALMNLLGADGHTVAGLVEYPARFDQLPQYNNTPYPAEYAMNTLVKPPQIKYDKTSNLFSVYGDIKTWRQNVDVSKPVFSMNENSQELFSNFTYQWLGLPNEETYQLCFYDTPCRKNWVTDPDGEKFVYVIQENESTSTLWCPVANITFCSTLIPIMAENEAPPLRVGAGNAQNFGIGVASNVSRIITDISVAKGSAYAYNGSVTFVPSGEYRITDFQGMGPVREIEVNIFWKCSLDGQLYPLPLPSGSIVTMKMMFRKKK